MTPATPLVCIGITICVITQRVCSGVTPDSLLLLRLSRRGFLAAFAVAILRFDARLELRLALLAAHLPGLAIVFASHSGAAL